MRAGHMLKGMTDRINKQYMVWSILYISIYAVSIFSIYIVLERLGVDWDMYLVYWYAIVALVAFISWLSSKLVYEKCIERIEKKKVEQKEAKE